MANGNYVTVTGNVTRDPELRFSKSGMAIAQFGIAWNRYRGPDAEESDDDVSFFDITCFRQMAENVAASVHKGNRVTVSGTLNQSRWKDKDTDKGRSKVEILADDVAASLRFAEAEIAPNERSGGGGMSDERAERLAGARVSNVRSAGRADAASDDEPF